MKHFLPLVAISMAFISGCTSSTNNAANDSLLNDTVVSDTLAQNVPAGEVCFLRTDGNNNQDSTKVHLLINGNKVTGEMQWLPTQKDSRKGTLTGTQQGNTINAVWIFMQEGMTDTLAVEFDFPGDKLSQKPFKANVRTGREQTDATSGYTLQYTRVDCE